MQSFVLNERALSIDKLRAVLTGLLRRSYRPSKADIGKPLAPMSFRAVINASAGASRTSSVLGLNANPRTAMVDMVCSDCGCLSPLTVSLLARFAHGPLRNTAIIPHAAMKLHLSASNIKHVKTPVA
jgi:hypothetical protein